MREHGSILTNQELHMTNVLAFRKTASPADLQGEMERIQRFIRDGNFIKTGHTATVTYSVEQTGNGRMVDFELLIPLDKPFVPLEGWVCKPVFRLVNAVSVRHVGNPANLAEAHNKLSAYIQEHNLQAITPVYNVTVQEAQTQSEADRMVVDVYMGVSPNIL